MPIRSKKEDDFFQQGPVLENQFCVDKLLQGYLRRKLPDEAWQYVRPELERLGERAVTDLLRASEHAERFPPVHTPFDTWGKRIDRISVASGWKHLERAAVEEGIVATAYERQFGIYSRIAQFAKLYLFHPSSAFVSCPLAMSDGAARAIELYGNEEQKNGPFRRLTSRNLSLYWLSGQWMTEKSGGSDVSQTATIARRLEGDSFELSGVKFFTSAVTAQMAMALGRIEGAEPGSSGLSLFYVPVRDSQGSLQNVEILRLKEKLGTRALPTAELRLAGVPAKLVGGEGGGVKKIASLFNITRLYNSVCAVAGARRAVALALDYSKRRQAFGRPLQEHPLHSETLADLVVELEGNFLLTFYLAELLGREELGQSEAGEGAILRMLTPVVKLYTGKSCMRITSEVMEVFGGAGYMEDSGIPTLLRNAQVFSIWEGTTNVLALDVWRAIEKDNAFAPFAEQITKKSVMSLQSDFSREGEEIHKSLEALDIFLKSAQEKGQEFLQRYSRRFAFSLARTAAAALLLERAVEDKSAHSAAVLRRWCAAGLGRWEKEQEQSSTANDILDI